MCIRDRVYYVPGTWVCMGLDGSTCSESLPEGTCRFEPPGHVPWTWVRAQTCVRGPGGLSACHGAKSTIKDPRPGEKKMSKGQKSTFIRAKRVSNCYIQKKNLCVCSANLGFRGGGRQTVYSQNTVYLCLSKYVPPVDAHVYDSMIPGTYYVPDTYVPHLPLYY